MAHIIAGHGAGKDVGGGGDLHRLPAQALATIWFICWIAGDGVPCRFSRLKTSEIRPVGRAAPVTETAMKDAEDRPAPAVMDKSYRA